MGPTEIEKIESFISYRAEVAILDQPGEDQAPFVKKTITKTGLCPDKTHLRIYFDDKYFFAVPLKADVRMSENEWSAYDHEAGLNYVIRRERGPDA
ncbi:hypothetical protein [Cytobacillus massiliigabonensis]|uniref:hypothetical protein n=1 Tax=Cytobacillus massiliigabonensis TaxID=1871011 RepID=UPI000C825C78|nr:hypothetical protein [Cytobacillus massiliigabonensis]